MDKLQIHKELCVGVHELYRTKNHDYGDSFARTREVVPNSILVRLHDKLNRLTTLMSGENAMVKDESIDDTLLDLANYALMELVERRYKATQHHPVGKGMDADELEAHKRALNIGLDILEKFDAGEHDILSFVAGKGTIDGRPEFFMVIQKEEPCKHFKGGYCMCQKGTPICTGPTNCKWRAGDER